MCILSRKTGKFLDTRVPMIRCLSYLGKVCEAIEWKGTNDWMFSHLWKVRQIHGHKCTYDGVCESCKKRSEQYLNTRVPVFWLMSWIGRVRQIPWCQGIHNWVFHHLGRIHQIPGCHCAHNWVIPFPRKSLSKNWMQWCLWMDKFLYVKVTFIWCVAYVTNACHKRLVTLEKEC